MSALAYDPTVTARDLARLIPQHGLRAFCGNMAFARSGAETGDLTPDLALIAVLRFPTLDLRHFARCGDCALRLRQIVEQEGRL